MKPFERICIVNRGEPAVRLCQAVRELCAEGKRYKTIALYTSVDRDASWLRQADERYELPLAPGRAYLDYASLLATMKAARAEAAWVGWGFVAEHAAFAELCNGPSSSSGRGAYAAT